ncbi:hypothetical protein GW537_05100 [Piscirickettsia salmonis]|nr:hypothetical protein [Piscirickettsia salmonis]QHS28616.1 hypothetical protein GW537_05100 [Piscirickettsia salmonis]
MKPVKYVRLNFEGEYLMMKGLIGILLLIGFLAIVITYWVARLEVPVLVSYELQKVLSLKINSEIFNLSYKK